MEIRTKNGRILLYSFDSTLRQYLRNKSSTMNMSLIALKGVNTMELKINSEEQSNLLFSSLGVNESVDQPQEMPKKPKLSMKFLHELIIELQHENYVLAKRIEDMEQQMKLSDSCHDVAATEEYSLYHELPKDILLPRSERHRTPANKPLWTYLFRFH